MSRVLHHLVPVVKEVSEAIVSEGRAGVDAERLRIVSFCLRKVLQFVLSICMIDLLCLWCMTDDFAWRMSAHRSRSVLVKA